MPDTVSGLEDMTIVDLPAPPVPDRRPAPVRHAACRRRLRARFLRAGREAVDECELLELLLTACHAGDAAALAADLIDRFGTAPRALAARPDRLRHTPGMTEGAVAALKAAEALAISMARERAPDTVRPDLTGYDKVIGYCRTLAGHGEVEQFHILYLDKRSRLIADEMQQRGTVAHAPAFPREVCIRALERQASAVIALHNHPTGSTEPSRADIETTRRIQAALKTIDISLLDHLIVTPNGALSFKQKGLI